MVSDFDGIVGGFQGECMIADFIIAKEICFATNSNYQIIVIKIANACVNFIFVGENPGDLR